MEGRGEFQAKLSYRIRICVKKLRPKQNRKKRRGMRRKKRRRDETEERKSEQTFLFFLTERHLCRVVVYHKIFTRGRHPVLGFPIFQHYRPYSFIP